MPISSSVWQRTVDVTSNKPWQVTFVSGKGYVESPHGIILPYNALAEALLRKIKR